MTPAELGSILASMSEYAGARARYRADNLGKESAELLYAIACIFAAGSQRCLDMAIEARVERIKNDDA